MPILSPHDLNAGMVLADPVYNLDGKLLFAEGTVLDDKKIEITMMWGVERIHIQGNEDDTQSISIQSFSNSIKQDAEAEIQQRFKLVKSSHPAVIAIRELAVLERAKSSGSSPSQS